MRELGRTLVLIWGGGLTGILMGQTAFYQYGLDYHAMAMAASALGIVSAAAVIIRLTLSPRGHG